jgi:hypothetical protein
MGKKDLCKNQTGLLRFNKFGVVKKELLYLGYFSISKPNLTVAPGDATYVSNLAISSETKGANPMSKVLYLRIRNNYTIESNGKKTTGAPNSLSGRRRVWP